MVFVLAVVAPVAGAGRPERREARRVVEAGDVRVDHAALVVGEAAAQGRWLAAQARVERLERARAARSAHKPRERPTAPLGGNAAENERLGEVLAAERGWVGGQWACLRGLFGYLEGGWRVTARNPGSGAYGIPQALPGRKMASAGGDWETNPATQIRWGLAYVEGRYGSPCAARQFRLTNGWY